jgi:hypothetical protein
MRFLYDLLLRYICGVNHRHPKPEDAPRRGDRDPINLSFTTTQTGQVIALQIHKQAHFSIHHSRWYMLRDTGCHRNLLGGIGGEECYVTASSLAGTTVRARCTLT